MQQHEARIGESPSRSLLDLVRELGDEMLTLMRQEIALSRMEYSEKLRFLTRKAVQFVIGATILYLGALGLFAAACVGAVYGLDVLREIDWQTAAWLGPLIVGALLALVGWAVMSSAKSAMSADNLKPERSMHSLKEDKEWIEGKFH